MDTPKVKFITSSTGESIAYTIHGTGPHLLVPAWWVSHLELDWQDECYQKFFTALGEHHTVIRYDRVGVGLSAQQRTSFELEDEISTLTELIDQLSVEHCSLLSLSCAGPAAIVYAQRNPQRINKLVFLGSFACGGDIGDKEIQNALCSLVSAHWGLGSKVILDLFDPDMEALQRQLQGKIQKQSASSDMASKLLKLTFKMDAVEAAKNLINPALILHRNKDRTVSAEAGKRLASLIPNAEYKTIEGKSHLPWIGEESEQFLKEILSFTAALAQPTNNNHNQFRQIDDVWSLSYAKKTVHVKNALGLHDIAQLLANSGNEVHSRILASGENTKVLVDNNQSKIIDRPALQQYRQRLDELLKEKKQAGQIDDEALYQTLEEEEDFLLEELARTTGLSGKQRSFNNDDERARKCITARIRASIKRIEALHPELADHLKQCISTGIFCGYNPTEDKKWLL
jgi:pimeloyl-ACP methyl ester carboxylesterase